MTEIRKIEILCFVTSGEQVFKATNYIPKANHVLVDEINFICFSNEESCPTNKQKDLFNLVTKTRKNEIWFFATSGEQIF